MSKGVSFDRHVRSLTNDQVYPSKLAEFHRERHGKNGKSYYGYSTTQNWNDRKGMEFQTPKEHDEAIYDTIRDERNRGIYYTAPQGEYHRMNGEEANQLFFDGVDKRRKRISFCDIAGKCFFITVAGLAAAKGVGLLGGKTYKKNKRNNRKTKRR